jgi:hypothetical protein
LNESPRCSHTSHQAQCTSTVHTLLAANGSQRDMPNTGLGLCCVASMHPLPFLRQRKRQLPEHATRLHSMQRIHHIKKPSPYPLIPTDYVSPLPLLCYAVHIRNMLAQKQSPDTSCDMAATRTAPKASNAADSILKLPPRRTALLEPSPFKQSDPKL